MNEQIMIFDSHTHYTDRAFDSDRDALLTSLPQQGVVRCMAAACDMESSADSVALAARYPHFYAAVGVHPEYKDVPSDYLQRLREMANNPKVKAIGEIGLDYHYDGYDADFQKKIFCEQLQLADELHQPVIIHCRDAMGDMLEILRQYRPKKGVMHCFSGSAESAKEVLKLGLYIGFTGVVTFKNARKPLEALAQVPLDRMLIETDCPYLAPVPYRGKRCDSTMLTEVIAVLASAKNISPAEIGRITAENAARLFDCPLDETVQG